MIEEVKMFTVICDACGKDVCEGAEYGAYSDAGYAQDVAMEEDWIVEDGKHYCTDCFEYDDEDNLIVKLGNKMNNQELKSANKVFAVTGVDHGSIVTAVNEEEARKIFQKHYDNEEIIVVKDISDYNLDNL